MLTLTALTVKTEGENGTERRDYMGKMRGTVSLLNIRPLVLSNTFSENECSGFKSNIRFYAELTIKIILKITEKKIILSHSLKKKNHAYNKAGTQQD